ncbi:FAD-binding protein [Amycolatopsis thermoflava]|uniref:FAD-binding protein n=1 Tax=Amycolatopsis thermoflava TaxID=84480 RepID=UPI003812088F
MTQTDRADVLVVGFGLAGAAAAIEAAAAGADVLVLDKLPLEPSLAGRRPRGAGRSGGDELRAGLRRTALERGVRVRPQATVHELLVEGRQVVGAGYAAIGPDTAEAAWHRRLYRMSLHARRSSAIVREVFTEAAERLWEESFVPGTIECAAVVVATPPSEWDFVGASLMPVLAADGRASATARPVRCPDAPERQTPLPALRVDPASGAVSSAGGWPVPGLFSATAGCADRRPTDAEAVAAGRRAGRACLPERAETA